jgi:hypothetical protein
LSSCADRRLSRQVSNLIYRFLLNLPDRYPPSIISGRITDRSDRSLYTSGEQQLTKLNFTVQRHTTTYLLGRLHYPRIFLTTRSQCHQTGESSRARQKGLDYQLITPILQLLVLNPTDRMALKDVLAHPWITQYSSKGRTSTTSTA